MPTAGLRVVLPAWFRIAIAVMLLALAGRAAAQLPPSIDVYDLREDVAQMERRSGPPRVADVWLLAGLGRALLLEGMQAAAEIQFNAALTKADRLQQPSLKRRIEAVRWQLLAVWQIRQEKPRAALEQLKALPGDSAATPNPPLSHAIRAAACAALGDTACLRGAWEQLLDTRLDVPRWVEERHVLDRLAVALDRAGLAERGASVLAMVAGMESEEDVRLEDLTEGARMMNAARLASPNDAYASLLEQILGRWLTPRDSDGQPVPLRNALRHREHKSYQLMMALVEQGHAALLAGKRDAAIESLRQFDRVMDVHRPDAASDRRLIRASEAARWGLQTRILANGGGHRETVQHVIQPDNGRGGPSHHVTRLMALAQWYAKADMRPHFQRHVKVLVDLPKSDFDRGQQRMLAFWLSQTGDLPAAWNRLWPLIEGPLQFASEANLADAFVVEDVAYLAFLALRWRDPAALETAQRAVDVALTLIPGDGAFLSLKSALSAATIGDAALHSWADALSSVSGETTERSWRGWLMAELAEAPWVATAAPSRAIGWLNAAATNRPSLAGSLGLRALSIAQAAGSETVSARPAATALAHVRESVRQRSTALDAFIADAADARYSSQMASCELRRRYSALGQPAQALVLLPSLRAPPGNGALGDCAPTTSPSTDAEMAPARSALTVEPGLDATARGHWLRTRPRDITRLWPKDDRLATLAAQEMMDRIDSMAGADLAAARAARRSVLDQLDLEGSTFSLASLSIARHVLDVDPTPEVEAVAEIERLSAAEAMALDLPVGKPGRPVSLALAYADRVRPSPSSHAPDPAAVTSAAAGPAVPGLRNLAPPSVDRVALAAGPAPASLPDYMMASKLARIARQVLRHDDPHLNPGSIRPRIVVDCSHLSVAGNDALRQEGLSRLSSSPVDADLAYRVSQLELFCGQRTDSDRAFKAALEAPVDSARVRHRHMVWRVADLANHDDLDAAQRAAQAWAQSLDQTLSVRRPTLGDRDIPPLMEELAATGVEALVEVVHPVVLRQVCSRSRSKCANMLLPGLRLRAEMLQARGGFAGATEWIRSLANDPATRLPAHRLLFERIEETPLRGAADARALLATYRSLPGDRPDLDRVPTTSAAIAMACWRDIDATLAIATDIHRTKMSRFNPPPDAALRSAAELDVVLRALLPAAPDVVDRWRRASLPLVDDAALRQAGTVPAARALLLAGRPEEAMAWLEGRVQTIRQATSDEDDVTDLFLAVAQYLLGMPADAIKPASLRVLETLNSRRFRSSYELSVPSGQILPLLMAHAARARGDGASALNTLLNLHATAADLKGGLAQDSATVVSRSTPVESFARYAAEDLRAVVERAVATRNFAQLSRIGVPGDESDSRAQLGHQLRETQRVLLALLLIDSGERLGLARAGREDMAFGIIQAATIGATALDLIQSLELAATSDEAVRNALVRHRVLKDVADSQTDLLSLTDDVDSASYAPRIDDPCASLNATAALDPERLSWTRASTRSSLRHGRVISEQESAMWPAKPAPVPARAGVPMQDASLPEVEGFLRQAAMRSLDPRTPVSLADVRRRLCPGRALYFVTTHEAASYGFLVTCSEVRAHELRLRQQALGEKTLNRTIKEIRSQIALGQEDRLLAADGAAVQLHDAMFGPWQTQLAAIEEITVVARGPLEELPFGVLPTPRRASDSVPGSAEAGRTWFGARYAWSFGLAGARVDEAAVAPRAFLGKPIVQIGPPRFTGAGSCNAFAQAKDRPLTELFCDLSRLEPLATSIADSLGDAPRPPLLLLLHDDFSRERLQALSRDQSLSKAGVLIVATHGLLASQAEQLGGKREPSLLIAGGPRGADMLTATDIAALSAGADEIVLASCHTAAGWGDGVADRGFSGLVRAFLRAGGRQVIAALYEVPADTTGILIEEYFAHRTQGLPGPRAMQAAVRQFVEKRGALLASPWAWGGMVYVGPY